MVSSAYSEVPNGTPPTRPKLRNGTVSRVVIGVCNSFSNNYAKFTALMHGNPRKPPPFVIWQEGNWQMVVGDEVRRKYDASGGAATACVGYGNHRVRKAMKSQIDHVAVTNELAFRTKISEKFSRALIATTDGLMAKVFVCNSGQYRCNLLERI